MPGSLVGEEQRRATDSDRDTHLRRSAPDRRPPMTAPQEPPAFHDADLKLPSWRRERARTTLWVVPSLLVLVAVVLFAITIAVDHLVHSHGVVLPELLQTGSSDAGREVLTAIAAAVITVVGVVFSITILALTLASQQFGPRMMRNFIRDVGSQVTLGVFVATFVYSVLGLGSITSGFVPHVTITVAEALLLVDVVVLIYFIHHIAKMIQLPEVIASIARDLHKAIDAEFPVVSVTTSGTGSADGTSAAELLADLERHGADVASKVSGYLQHVAYPPLVEIAARHDAVIQLTYRPGHFVVAGRTLARVLPASAAPEVAASLDRAHVTGPHRTLFQDPVFAIDQLVEIAIRALSAAVNDTFTALTCIDWLSAGLSELSRRTLSGGLYRDGDGAVRLLAPEPSYERMVNRAFDKVRQAASGMPAVLIRLLDGLWTIAGATTSQPQRDLLHRQAVMVHELAEATVREPNDLADLRARYDRCAAALRPSIAAREPS